MIKKAIAMMSLAAAITACSKNDDTTPGETYVDDYMDIMYVNQNNQSLLNSSTEDSINLQQVNVYYIRNDDTIKVVDPLQNTAPGIMKIDEGDTAAIRFFFGVDISQEATGELEGELIGQSVRMIEVYPGDLDTLVGNWVSTRRTGHVITKVSYNGEVVFDPANNINQLKERNGFKIVK